MRFVTLCLLALLSFIPNYAGAAPLMDGRNTAIELLAAKDAVVPGQSLDLMVRIRIRDHWHIYWVNPGDSGEALRLTWTLPDGVTLGDVEWPTPKRLPYGPLVNFGYEKEARFTLPANIPATLTGTEATFKVRAEVLVCEEICIPEYQDLSLTLPIAAAAKADNAYHFKAAFEAMPDGTDDNGKFYETAKGDLVLLLPNSYTLKTESVFPLDWGVIENAAPQKVESTKCCTKVTVKRGTRSLDKFPQLKFVLRDAQGVGLTVLVDKITEAEADAVIDKDNSGINPIALLAVLGLAALGGLILNLMPCVFPILSLKALSLVKLSDAERTHSQKSALAYTAGIVTCFLLLAATLIALRGAGQSIGWGFQLQNPMLVTALSWLMALVGFNLLGFFELSGLGGIGQKLTKGTGLTSSFWTGVLAAVVATPCTAPFMATALGVALVQPWHIALLIFVALGLGLALPFLLIAFVPYLARHLPRPGVWMERFRQFLAFPMFAASLWLIWVAVAQTGHNGLLFILSGVLLLGFIVWLLRFKGLTVRVLTLLSAVILCALLAGLPGKDAAVTSNNIQAFSQQMVDDAIAQNRPVFVNMTAKWCVTCLLNDRVAISIPATQKLFKDKNVLYMKGDWTDQNAAITKFMARYGRSGVPLYVYFSDGKETVLPQLLTPSIVANAVGSH